VNPYGVAIVGRSTGNLIEGNVLVSNFNNSSNLQGTGTTIMEIAPNGAANLFAWIDASSLPGSCPGGVGLTTALVALRAGWVIVGSLPTTDGTAATAQAGCLLVLNSTGTVVETISNVMINGPWDMTVLDQDSTASLFVTNVLNGTVAGNGDIVHGGTVVRIDLTTSPTMMPTVTSMTVIGSGFAERTDPAALVIGPTGVALGADGSLYVADSLNNRIMAIGDAVTRTSSAMQGTLFSAVSSLNDPLGVTVRPNTGEVMVVNGNNGLLLVLNASGQVASTALLDKSGMPPGAGALFGLATSTLGLFYVDDATNTLNLLSSTP
jgi:DNA-binding beta-propeller fold protein YncE